MSLLPLEAGARPQARSDKDNSYTMFGMHEPIKIIHPASELVNPFC